jgi:transposase
VNRESLLSLSKDDLVALILALTARVAALEARLAAPPKTPDNSSLPPSKGQKPNLPDRPKKGRHGRPGVARALAEHPDTVIVATLPA